MGELAQLRAVDIEHAAGIPMLSISNEGEGQRVKTTAEIRKVPIHSDLVRLGFLDYAARHQKPSDAPLLPSLPPRKGKPGGYFSHWFGVYRRSLGFGKYPDFHCFRHTVRSQLANAGVSEALIDTLVGHEVAGSTGAKVYTHRTPQTLAEAMTLLHYPSLKVFNPPLC